MEVLRRIITSRKTIEAAIGSALVVFLGEGGLSDAVILAVGTLFSVLVTVQGFLDYRFGSRSDRTGQFTEYRETVGLFSGTAMAETQQGTEPPPTDEPKKKRKR